MYKGNYCSVIVVAAGSGKRMGTKLEKQFLSIGGMPILARTLQRFESMCAIDEIVLVVPVSHISYCQEHILEPYRIKKVKAIQAGGRERQISVYQGLQKVSGKTNIVLIHDGVRPFISKQDTEKVLDGVIDYGACVLGVPVKDTIKICNAEQWVISTPDRSTLWQIQTPQAFVLDSILKAHRFAMENQILETDDAALAERFGIPVKIIEGSYSNIKITTPEDLLWAETLLKGGIYDIG